MDQYGQCLLARRQAMDKLETVERELRLCLEELRGKLARGCTAAEAVQGHAYQRSLGQRRDECFFALETAERRVNAALQNMFHASQQREIVDKYFDKQKAAYAREQGRLEQKFLDDLAGRRGNSIFAWKPTDTPL